MRHAYCGLNINEGRVEQDARQHALDTVGPGQSSTLVHYHPHGSVCSGRRHAYYARGKGLLDPALIAPGTLEHVLTCPCDKHVLTVELFLDEVGPND